MHACSTRNDEINRRALSFIAIEEVLRVWKTPKLSFYLRIRPSNVPPRRPPTRRRPADAQAAKVQAHSEVPAHALPDLAAVAAHAPALSGHAE